MLFVSAKTCPFPVSTAARLRGRTSVRLVIHFRQLLDLTTKLCPSRHHNYSVILPIIPRTSAPFTVLPPRPPKWPTPRFLASRLPQRIPAMFFATPSTSAPCEEHVPYEGKLYSSLYPVRTVCPSRNSVRR